MLEGGTGGKSRVYGRFSQGYADLPMLGCNLVYIRFPVVTVFPSALHDVFGCLWFCIFILSDLLLQSEQASEAELHPQLNRAPSQAAESSPTKKVWPAQTCHCRGAMSPPLGLCPHIYSLRFSGPDMNVIDLDVLELGFSVKMGS